MKPNNPLAAASAAFALALAAPAMADDDLAALVNAWRASARTCAGSAAGPAPPLKPVAALARVQLGPGEMPAHAVERTGYTAEEAEIMTVTGPHDARGALETIEKNYCATLLSGRYSEIGVARNGNLWQVVLARPYVPVKLPDWPDAGKVVLQAVNAARAEPRTCGDRFYPAAPPLAWSDALGNAALAHSSEMAQQRYFAHQGKDGTVAGDRASRAGYAWRSIGENIASGLGKPEDAVAGWLASPGHCANIMNPRFSEMGAAWAVAPESRTGMVYWTQVLAVPR
jgi:hypothetical protein